ncbi:hypothetical protein [Mesorhizobium sp.]|nr:hypothetical protein [Mesorhizobium sp.]
MNLYLQTAIMHWKRGYPLPTDLALKLASLGYDVHALEARYSR